MEREVFWPQYAATVAASLTSISTSATFAWSTSAYPYLTSVDSHIPHSQQDVSVLQLVMMFTGIVFIPIAFYCSDKIGRKKTMMIHNGAGIVSLLVLIFGSSRTSVLISRALAGAQTSIDMIVGNYVSEIGHVQIRTRLLQLYSFSFAVGFFKMYVFATVFTYDQIAKMSLITPTCALLLFIWLPESPYFYVMKEKTNMAHVSLKKLGYSDVTNEINLIKSTLIGTGKEINWKNFLKDRGIRKAFYTCCFLLFIVNMSGIVPVSIYSQSIINPKCHPFLTPQLSVLIVQISSMTSQILSIFITKRFGVKVIYFWSLFCAAIFLLLLSAYFFIGSSYSEDCKPIACLPLVILIFYQASCSPGVVGLTSTMMMTYFPMEYKQLIMSLISFMYSVVSFVVMTIFEIVRNEINLGAGFLTFGIVTVINGFFIFKFIPETSQKQFSEIYEWFGINTKQDEDSEKNIIETEKKILLIEKNGIETDLNNNINKV